MGWNHAGTSADAIKRGTWETYEYYLKFGKTSVEDGGSARIRVWKNGVLLKDMTDRVTLKDENYYVKALNVFTYWNGHAQQTQSMYVDD